MALTYIFSNQTQPNLAWLDVDLAEVGALTTLPCVIAGTNSLTLTQSANTPTIAAYANYIRFSGIIAVTNTSTVTAQVGSLAALPVYKDTSAGPVALVSGDLKSSNYVVLTYDSALNSGGGGFHVNAPSAGSGTGTVTSVATGTGLTGGPITTTGTLSLANAANLTIKSNISGGAAIPTDNTATAILDQAFGNTQGAVLFRNSTIWTVLGPGTNGQFLETQGAGANIVWGSPSGSGTVNSGGAGQIAYYAGAGTVVSGTSAPNILIATGTSLALGGATIGSDALGVTGTASISGNFTLGTSAQLLWSTDLILTRHGAASLQQGAADVDTSPVAQTFRSQGALAGGTSDVAGANWTFIASPGKGTGKGGSFVFQTTPAGTTGTAVNAPVTALSLNSFGLIKYGVSFTVSTLPAAGATNIGARTFITDGAAVPVFGAIVSGSGSLFLPVFSDGTNWRNG